MKVYYAYDSQLEVLKSLFSVTDSSINITTCQWKKFNTYERKGKLFMFIFLGEILMLYSY